MGSKAPEQLKARLSHIPYDERVDVFSYGLLLFYLLTNGHRAFEELSGAFEMDRAVEEVGDTDEVGGANEHSGCGT